MYAWEFSFKQFFKFVLTLVNKDCLMKKVDTAIKTTYFSILGNTLLALIKGLAGFFGNSYALIADAIESTTDICCLLYTSPSPRDS